MYNYFVVVVFVSSCFVFVLLFFLCDVFTVLHIQRAVSCMYVFKFKEYKMILLESKRANSNQNHML